MSKWKIIMVAFMVVALLAMFLSGCAEEEKEKYDLTITVSPAGSGTTVPAAGTHEYEEDEVVTITATAATGYEFDHWSGAATGTTTSATVTMTSDKTLTAHFTEVAPVTYTLTMAVAPAGSGTTTPAVGTHDYDAGTVVDITATPASGYQFDSWTGDVANANSATTTVTMNADETVTANFVQLFNSWTGDVANATSATTTVTMNADETVTANFTVMTYTLTMAVSPAGGGTTDPAVGTHDYDAGTVVDITATAAAGYQFDSWTGAVANATSATTTVTMNADKTVTANFVQLFTLTMAVSGNGSTDPAVGDHEYAAGTVVDITATPDVDSYFVNWTGDVADGNSESTTVTVDADKTVTANFTATAYTLTMAVSPEGAGTTTPAVGDHVYGEGRVVTITATAASGYEFDSWTGDVVDGTVTMDDNKTVTANFVEVVAPAYPPVGTTWVYQVTYGAEVTEWTVTVDSLETVDTTDSYHTATSYSAPPVRVVSGLSATVLASEAWLSQITLDAVKSFASVNLFGMAVATDITRTYTGGTHGAPYSAGQTWTYDEAMVLTPPLAPSAINSYEAEVVAMEDVTTVAGTYSCYKIEYTLVATDGVPVTPVLEMTEWWSADVLGVVKSINHTGYAEVETQELLSYTPG